MKATVIKIARKSQRPDAPLEHPGWIVPDTDELLAVDLRVPADIEYLEPAQWYITHIPTGFRVNYGPYTDADTRERAVELAQAFYREMKALGVELSSPDASTITKPVTSLSSETKRDFWNKVAGWHEQRK